ncbi:MAG TPA: glycosyltransferase [Pirellulales bacterium]
MSHLALISEHASPLGSLGGVDSGGQNVYVAQVARHLAAFGHTVDVFTRRDDVRLAEVVEPIERLRIIHVPAGPPSVVRKENLLPWMDDFARFVGEWCGREGKYDLVHANFFMSGIVASRLKEWFDTPFVITFHALGRVRRMHQGAADGFPEERFEIEARLMNEAARIIAECPQDRADQLLLYRADPQNIRVVPCGFDRAELWPIDKAEARSHLGLPIDERIVLHLGRLVPRKGADNVVRGFARWIRRQWHPARLYIVGGETDLPSAEATPEIGRLQRITEEERMTPYVVFAGRAGRATLKYWYSAADVFVTTPWYEPFGITPVEAMACGTPVIGADVGGIKYSIENGRTGLLVPPKDPERLADRLTWLFERKTTCAQMSAAAIDRANRHFTWQGVTAALDRVYREVIEDSLPADTSRGERRHPSAPMQAPLSIVTHADFNRSVPS